MKEPEEIKKYKGDYSPSNGHEFGDDMSCDICGYKWVEYQRHPKPCEGKCDLLETRMDRAEKDIKAKFTTEGIDRAIKRNREVLLKRLEEMRADLDEVRELLS